MLIRCGLILFTLYLAAGLLQAQEHAGTKPTTKVLFQGPRDFKTGSGRSFQEESWKLTVDDYIYKDFYRVLKDKTYFKPLKIPKPGNMHPSVGFKKFIDMQYYVNQTFFSCRVFESKPHTQYERHFQAIKPTMNLPDWQGYEVLRLDIKPKKDITLWWSLLDAKIQPPIVGNFTLKKDTWYTLELDLEAAVKKRQLDLTNVKHTWLSSGPGASGVIANVRLEKRSVKTTHPVVKDPKATSYPTLPEKISPPKLDIKANLTALKKPKIISFDAGWETRIIKTSKSSKAQGSIAIFDQDNVLLLHQLFNAYPQLDPDSTVKRTQYNAPLSEIFAAQTLNGGKTWTGLEGDKKPTHIYCDRATRFHIIDNRGDIITWNNNGCGSKPYGPWQRMRKFTFEGSKGWTRWKQDRVLEEEASHCTHGTMDFVRTPNGRIWAALGIEGRWAPPNFFNVHAKYSDTDGKHWISWEPGFTSRIPEMSDQYPAGITPYKDYVAVVKRNHFRSKAPAAWTFFDGKTWAKPMPFPTNYINSVASVGEQHEDLVVSTYAKDGVVVWDGKKWKTELAAKVKLCKSGDTLMGFAFDEAKGILNIYHRQSNGTWNGPEKLTLEPALDNYIPRFCPANLGAIAYVPKKEPTKIKVVMVPNKLWKGK